MVSKPAVIGIDIGTDTSFVGFVSKGIVDIVQNEVSQRKTPSLVGFTGPERLLGDAALSQIKSNAKNTCRNMKLLLGRPLDAPDLQVEKFWSTCPLAPDQEGFAGYDVNYKDEPKVFSAGEMTAMFLTKLKDITEAWTQSKVADVVIGVPSNFADQQRQALLDAAEIAGMNVLRIMNEHTAVALAYGIYRSNDFDPDKPQNVVFCNMGHSIFSVSVVAFVKGRLTVICEFNDKVGGRDMNECLIRKFAAEFQKKTGCDILNNKKALIKMEDAVEKCKKILSANNEAPCSVECLAEDEDFASTVQRDDFENMCTPMMDKVKKVLDKAREACGLAPEDIHFVEVAGGSSRVPWLKKFCSDAWYGKELSTTLNADECVARGCTLQAAILSPLFKVRDFKVEDTSPFAVSVGWMGTAAEGDKGEEDGDAPMAEGGAGEWKTATVFPAKSAMNLLKMLTFFRKGPFDIKASYAETDNLLPMTPAELGTFKVELPPQAENKKVKVKAKLTQHGTFSLESAQMVEEEEYEDTVKEKVEIPPEELEAEAAKEAEAKKEEKPDEPMPDAEKKEGEEPKEGEEKKPEEPKAPEKKYKWVEVKKMKKRTKRTDLNITASGTPGLDKKTTQLRKDAETQIIAEQREIVETNNARNDLEGYCLDMRSKIEQGGKYGDFITAADRDKFSADLTAGEDWLFDHYDEKKVVYIEKLEELKKQGNPVVWRYTEDQTRGDWIGAVEGTISNYRAAASEPGDKYNHIAPDKLASIVKECDDLAAWLNDMKAKQAGTPKDVKPVLLCADMEKKNTALAQMADKILAEKKPEPPKEKKEEKPKEEGKTDEKPPEGGEAPPPEGPANMDVD